MMGSTHDDNINMSSLDCCHQTKSHRDMSIKDYIDGIVHEIVHIFHHELREKSYSKNIWFDEAKNMQKKITEGENYEKINNWTI